MATKTANKKECPTCSKMYDVRGWATHIAHCSGEAPEAPSWTCPECGRTIAAAGRGNHTDAHARKAQADAAIDRPPIPPDVRSRRGWSPRGVDATMSPLEQIRRSPTVTNGAGAYYLDKDGATIREALIYYPNGASASEVGKYGENSDYYQARQAKKGFKYLGATLGPSGVRELVDTLVTNRPDEIKITQYKMDECDYTLRHSGVQKEREVAARRRQQFAKRMELLQKKIDTEGLIQELEEIGEAQTISRLDGPTRKAMELLLAKQNERVLSLVKQLGKRQPAQYSDAEVTTASVGRLQHNDNWDGSDDDFQGVNEIFVDNDDD